MAASVDTHREPKPNVEVTSTAVGRLDGDEIAAARSAVGLARAERLSLEMGVLGVGLAERATVSQSVVRRLAAGNVETEQSLVGSLVAGRVTFRRASGTIVLIAARVDGDVRTLLDWRGALAAGAAPGLLVGLLRRRG